MTGTGRTADVGPEGPPGADPEVSPGHSGVDPELVALPAPPQGRRLATLTLMALVAAASLGLLAGLRSDIRYFLSPAMAQDVGEATELDPASLATNEHVRVRGTPMASRTVRYSHLWNDREYAVFPLAGQRHVLVRVALEDMENMRTSSRREFAGRLVTLGQLGSAFGPVREYLQGSMGVDVSSETFVLLADEPPGRYGGSVLLAALCLLFIVVDVVLMVRWFRPFKER
ncbi:MAG: hypothetical protein ACOCXM_01450 [Myxococcota bacterium]